MPPSEMERENRWATDHLSIPRAANAPANYTFRLGGERGRPADTGRGWLVVTYQTRTAKVGNHTADTDFPAAWTPDQSALV